MDLELEPDDVFLSQAVEAIENTCQFQIDCFTIPCADDVALSEVCDTAYSGDNDVDDLLLTQMCAEFEHQGNGTALAMAREEEMRESEAHLGVTHEDIMNAIDSAIDCRSMPMEGGCDMMSSWSFPKKQGMY